MADLEVIRFYSVAEPERCRPLLAEAELGQRWLRVGD